jgi:hypothetical protein
VQIDPRHRRGAVKGADGQVRPFERSAMVRWLQFDDLRPGTPVSYELEPGGRVINVEVIE